MNIFTFLSNNITKSLLGADTTTDTAVTPIYSFLTTFGPVLMGMLLGVGTIYCIVLGVQYSRAESADDRKTAKQKMVNAIWGFVTIIILVAILYGLRVPISNAL